MVEAGKMQQAMQYQDLYFRGQIVPKFSGVGGGDLERDCNVTCYPRHLRRERQDIGGLVLVAEATIQCLHLAVRGDANVHITLQGKRTPRTRRKATQGLRVIRFRGWFRAIHFCLRTNGRADKPSHNMVASFYSEMRLPLNESATGGTSAREASRSTVGAFTAVLAIRGAPFPLPLVVFHTNDNCSLRPLWSS